MVTPEDHTHKAAPTLLCEHCGYDLSATPPGDPCAECGRPYSASHPDRRTGSPFQRKPSLRAFLATTFRVMIDPTGDQRHNTRASADTPRLWAMLKVEPRRSLAFASITATAAATLAWLVLLGSPQGAALLAPRPAIGFVINGVVLIALLSAVESLGVQLIGVKSHWRISPRLAVAVVAHATPGWYTAALLAPLGWTLGQYLRVAPSANAPTLANILVTEPPFLLAALGFLAGLLHFELLVYIAIRNCRFANPPDAASPARPSA